MSGLTGGERKYSRWPASGDETVHIRVDMTGPGEFSRPVPVPGQAALHEWECPSCGATTRARMADHPTGQAAREAAVHVLREWSHEHSRWGGPRRTAEQVADELAALSAAPGQEQP